MACTTFEGSAFVPTIHLNDGQIPAVSNHPHHPPGAGRLAVAVGGYGFGGDVEGLGGQGVVALGYA